MNVSEIFIRRPIATSLLMAGIAMFGIIAYRARPVSDHPLLVLTSYSFPSGHVAGATLFYGFLAAIYASGDSQWGRKVMAVLGATAVVALVALSRMVLGVHYLSDVLAAFAEGVAWLTVCTVGVRTYWQYRAGNQRGR